MLKYTVYLLFIVFAVNVVASGQGSAKKEPMQKEPGAVKKIMTYGKKEAGKVYREEVKDQRLLKLFDLADTKKEGVVTKDQLIVAAKKLESESSQETGRREGGHAQRGGFGGGSGGFGGGPGGGRGRPQPGAIMPDFIQDELELSEAQRKQLSELQKEVDTKVGSILTDEQKKKYEDLKNNPFLGGPNGRGPGFRGGPPGVQ